MANNLPELTANGDEEKAAETEFILEQLIMCIDVLDVSDPVSRSAMCFLLY